MHTSSSATAASENGAIEAVKASPAAAGKSRAEVSPGFASWMHKIALVVFASTVLAAGAASAQGQSDAPTAGTVNRLPSIVDIALVFFGFLKGINLWYLIPMIASWFYGLIYRFYLRKAALYDLRNRGQQETRHYRNVIFWERIANYDLFAIIYAICIPLMPILFFLAAFNTFKR
jgi:hypothetical protein